MAEPFARLIRVGYSARRGASSAGIEKLLRTVIKKHAVAIQRHIRGEMSKPKHGRTYVFNGRSYVASAPGEAPAIRSGDLYRAIIPKYSPSGLQAFFRPVVPEAPPYPRFLEQGTVKMAPRPYLKPALDIQRRLFLAEVRKIVRNAIRV